MQRNSAIFTMLRRRCLRWRRRRRTAFPNRWVKILNMLEMV